LAILGSRIIALQNKNSICWKNELLFSVYIFKSEVLCKLAFIQKVLQNLLKRIEFWF